MNRNRIIIAPALAAVAALTLAACGGGGGKGAAVLPSSSSATTSALPTAMSQISFSFTKPAAATSSSTRTAQYLPSTIESVAVGVSLVNGTAPSPAVATTTASVGPSAPGCGTDPNNSSNYLCTLTFALPIGSDTLSVKAYDGTSPGSNLISQQEPVVNVVAAHANQFAMTLDAVPGTIALGTLPPGVNCGGTPVACAVSVGTAAKTVPVTIADAHGSLITGNSIAGTPALSASSSNTAAVTVSVTQNPYAVIITPAASGSGSATITLTATPASTGDGIASTTILTTSIALNPAPATLATPIGMTFDKQGNLWVANFSGNGIGQVTEYAPPYTGTPIFAVGNILDATSVAFDAAGNLYVSLINAAQILIYAPPYSGTPITMSEPHNPFQMTFDTNGNLYAATTSGIDVFDPPFTSSSVPNVTIATSPGGYGIAFDSAGNLWFAMVGSGLEKYTLPLTAMSTPALSVVDASALPYSELAFDPSGNLYYWDGNGITEFSPPISAGSVPAQSLPIGYTAYGVAANATMLFSADFRNNVINGFTFPLTSGSTPALTVQGQHRSTAPQSLILPRPL